MTRASVLRERFYYSQKAFRTGIWRVPVDGGEEVEVLAGPIFFGTWDLASGGIYYATGAPLSDDFRSETTSGFDGDGQLITYSAAFTPKGNADRASLEGALRDKLGQPLSDDEYARFWSVWNDPGTRCRRL